MERCDVVVAGGGPAGSTLAWRLGRAGHDVVVLDRARFPRDKVCAGWITPGVVDALELDLADYARDDRVLQPIHAFRVGLMDGRHVRTPRADQPLGYGIRRCEFDDYLLRRSRARVHAGEPLGDLARERDGSWIVNGRIRARLVVGAGGHFCPVARLIGAVPAREERVVSAQEIEFEMAPAQRDACRVERDVPELYFCSDLRGYGWAFRKGDFLNVGLGREDPRGLPERVAEFRDLLIAQGVLPASAPRKFRGHAYLLHESARREVWGDGVLLVGDAAGLAYPESGEGIRPAVESALIAAEVVVAASGDYRAERLRRYGDLLARRFGARSERRRLTDRMPAGVRLALARRLLRARWFVSRVVVERWFLHAHAPPLAAVLAGSDRG